MYTIRNLRGYQLYGIRQILKHPYCALFLGMGLGKTVASLTAVWYILFKLKRKYKVLVLAPLNAAKFTWPAELENFEHLQDLKMSLVVGNPAERTAALRTPADVYVMNHDNVVWLVKYYKRKFPFDFLIVDESSWYKSPKAKRFRALRAIRPFLKRVVLLSGTPMSNSYMDLWTQMYLLDQGKRLGNTITAYRKKYFDEEYRDDRSVYVLKTSDDNYIMGKDIYEKVIIDKLWDICISMDTRAYIELPPVTIHEVLISLGDKYLEYKRFRKEKIIELPEINAVNAGALANKLKQFATGQVYDQQRIVHTFHELKLKQLEELIVTAAQPVLVFYWYEHERDRILKHFTDYRVSVLGEKQDLQRWNTGKVDILLLHPRSAAHGLNLQDGGHIIIWYSLPYYSQELFRQANARLDRSGQKWPVQIYVMLMVGTVEEDELKVIYGKMEREQAFLNAVKAIM